MFEQERSMDALLLGRRTYEIFASCWPTAPDEIPFTGLFNGVPKYFASRTLADPLTWQGSSIVATCDRSNARTFEPDLKTLRANSFRHPSGLPCMRM